MAAPIRLGPYLLTECIGRGGMAAVYKGKRRGAAGFDKEVVVKTLLPELAKNARFKRLFQQEARLTAQLHHDNVVRVHDFGVIGDTPFLELEYLSGWNLLQLWEAVSGRGQRVPVGITLALAIDVCRGLAYAHSFVDSVGVRRPIIHRDVSPANIMISRDGAVKLLDFGLARQTRGETLAIETFQGKVAYMSPEQLDRKQLDRRADVFALGTLLHELLTGRRLFGVPDDGETLRRIQSLAIVPPSTVNPTVPAALDVIVLRALMRNPGRRYQSAAEMSTALEELGGLAASRENLLSYLGSVAPTVFTATCEACGQELPCGVDCPACRTQTDPPNFAWQEPFADEAPSATGPALLLPRRSSGWLPRQMLLFYLTLCLQWRRLEAWAALRKSLALERAWRARSAGW